MRHARLSHGSPDGSFPDPTPSILAFGEWSVQRPIALTRMNWTLCGFWPSIPNSVRQLGETVQRRRQLSYFNIRYNGRGCRDELPLLQQTGNGKRWLVAKPRKRAFKRYDSRIYSMRLNGNGKKISNDEENQQICCEEKVDTRAPRASHATFEEYTSSVNVPARCLKQLAASR